MLATIIGTPRKSIFPLIYIYIYIYIYINYGCSSNMLNGLRILARRNRCYGYSYVKVYGRTPKANQQDLDPKICTAWDLIWGTNFYVL